MPERQETVSFIRMSVTISPFCFQASVSERQETVSFTQMSVTI